MKSTKVKAVKKTPKIKPAVEAPVEKKVAKNLPVYHLYVKINGVEHETDTQDLFTSIMSFKPAIVMGNLIIKVTKNGKTRDKFVFMQRDAQRIFWNHLTLQFIIRALTIDL